MNRQVPSCSCARWTAGPFSMRGCSYVNNCIVAVRSQADCGPLVVHVACASDAMHARIAASVDCDGLACAHRRDRYLIVRS
jgi:hypothetical protein